MDFKDHIIGELIFDEEVDITSFIDTHIISGMLSEIGPGALEVTTQPGHYKLGGTEYIFAGETITLTPGNTLIWIDNTAVLQQGTSQPASGTILLAVVADNGSAVTDLDVSPVNVMYQVMQIYTGNLEINTGVSRSVAAVDYLSNNILIDNDSLKESLENIDIGIGDRTYTEQNVISNNEILTISLDKLDLKFGDLATINPGEGASLIGVEDALSIITAQDVEGALQEIFSALNDHDTANTNVHGVTGEILGTTDTQAVSNKTFILPVIGDFTNAQHDHSSTSEGGLIDASNISNMEEVVQDLIGNTFVDTSSIDFTYSDSINQISAVVLPGGIDHNLLWNYDPTKHLTESQMTLGNIGTRPHMQLTNIGPDDHHAKLHTITSHTDTTATGTQLDNLTDGTNADSLHVHSISGISNFNETVQDVVGALVIDTLTIGWVYDDPGNTLRANVKEQNLNHDNLSGFMASRHLTENEMSLNNLGSRAHSMLSAIGPNDHHSELHTISSHSDTSATGIQLDVLTDGSNADLLHTHTAPGLTGIEEIVQDIVGGMVSGNTETDIVVSYDDPGGKLNFVVEDNYLRNDQDTSTVFNITAKEFRATDGIRLFDPTPGPSSILIKAPTGFSNYVITLPTTNGDPNQLLQTNGDGILNWIDPFDPASPPVIGNVTPNEVNATEVIADGIKLKDDDTNFITLEAPANVGSDYTLIFPASVGIQGDVLRLDATLGFEWVPSSLFLTDDIFQSPGDLLHRNDGNNTARLPADIAGRVLKSRGINKAPSWSNHLVRILTAGGKVVIIADRAGVTATMTDGLCTVDNSVCAQIERIEVSINEFNCGDLDPSGNYTVIFSSGMNDINNFDYPTVTYWDRSNTAADGDLPTEAEPYKQYVCSEDINNGLRARLIGTDRVKIMGLQALSNYGTLILQF